MFLEDFKGLSLVTFYHSLQVVKCNSHPVLILKSVNNNEIQILIKSAIELTKMIWFGALSCEPPWNLYLLKSTPKLKSAHISCTLNPVRAPILFQYCDSTARVHSLPLLWKYSLQICYSTVLASVPFNKHQSSSLQTLIFLKIEISTLTIKSVLPGAAVSK